jgi:hypothetical protein
MSKSSRALIAASAIMLALAILSGCATTRVIDSDVQSFTGTTAAVRPATYRFERLPSQLQSKQQDQLEAMAVQALKQVGLTQAAGDVMALYTVQVTARVTVLQVTNSYSRAGGFWGRNSGFGMGLLLEPTWYRHEVRVLLREHSSGQVAYETSASFDGPWNDSGNLLPVLLQAALQDYPQPPAGPRKVNIECPAQQP